MQIALMAQVTLQSVAKRANEILLTGYTRFLGEHAVNELRVHFSGGDDRKLIDPAPRTRFWKQNFGHPIEITNRNQFLALSGI